MKNVKLLSVGKALIEVPIFEKHRRGKNWLAIISVEPTAPGGLGRKFCPRGNGECVYIIEQLSRFDAVEFGADYLTWSGNTARKRWYGVVIDIRFDFVLLEAAESGAKAVIRARELREKATRDENQGSQEEAKCNDVENGNAGVAGD